MARKQKDGRYRSKISVGTDVNGEAIYKYASGRTKKELEANAEELKKRYIGGVEVQRDVTVEAYITEWYEAFKEADLSPSTRLNYLAAMNHHIFPNIGDRRMSAVTSTDLHKLMGTMSGMGKTSIGNVKSIIKNAFREASSSGIIDRDPAASLKKAAAETKSRRELTDKEVSAALSVAESHPAGLMLALLYYTGMRRGEMLGLTWTDVDLKKGVIHVCRDIDFVTNDVGDVKSQCSIRDIPIPIPLKRILRARAGIGFIIKGPDTGRFMPQATYIRTWKSLMAAMYQADPTIEHSDLNANVKPRKTKKAAKAKSTIKCTPLIGSVLTAHYFRHNYATLLYDAGVDVLTAQKYLGHADPVTTLRIYTHLKNLREQGSKQKVIEMFGK
jgi:integrase